VSKAGAVLVALLTTGMGGGDVKINDLWIFVSRMSASLKTLSVRNLSDAPLPFKMIKNNEYINFYNTEDITLTDGTHITAIDLRLSKDRDGAACDNNNELRQWRPGVICDQEIFGMRIVHSAITGLSCNISRA
jgi:hypothetical protein